MTRMNEIFNWKFWIWQPLLGIVLPLIINLLPGSWFTFKVVVAIFAVNMVLSVIVGMYLRKHGSFWILLIVWPLIFLISVWLHINSANYGYYMALTYLVIELFAFTRGQEEEIDVDEQLPIDGGMKNL
ncbi:MAG: hypothetical protein LBT80_04510 [Lactobacillaceae bacterium]|jgi:hypothetical protein|nr:hypothetical protein [Lactobacillaceae bacterium]